MLACAFRTEAFVCESASEFLKTGSQEPCRLGTHTIVAQAFTQLVCVGWHRWAFAVARHRFAILMVSERQSCDLAATKGSALKLGQEPLLGITVQDFLLQCEIL